MQNNHPGPARSGISQRVDRVPPAALDPTWSLMSAAHRRFPVEVRRMGARGTLRTPPR